jgi:hypothetical protein
MGNAQAGAIGIQEYRGLDEWTREVFIGCPEGKNVYLYANEAPGWGMEVDEKAAAKYPYGNNEKGPRKELNDGWGEYRRRGRLAKRLVQVGIRTAKGHQREQAQRFGIEMIEMKDWRGHPPYKGRASGCIFFPDRCVRALVNYNGRKYEFVELGCTRTDAASSRGHFASPIIKRQG